jgi:formate dehydrogenase major subunit
MITLTINGRQITASPDQTILQVCRDQKIDNIPTLCYEDKLPPFGSCFLCVVEVEGQSRLLPSCATKVTEGMVISTHSEKVVRARKTCLELLLSDHYADCFGPCRLSCPADVDIQGYMSLISLGQFREAISLIKEKNPLPSVCGRVCTRKCELSCRRNMLDEPVGIDFLKRYIADWDMIDKMWQPKVEPLNGKRVAIVGSGPAGLTCAYYLRCKGYSPTIYESLPGLGGMLRYGIPEYRLPKEVLDKEINWILDLGVDVFTNRKLGRDFQIDDLFAQGNDAVFVALGAQIGKPMQVDNEDVAGVLSGVDFLQQVQLQTNPPIAGRVVVVGGGNTAIDAARTSLRLGADEVVLLYRRTRNEMPANMIEIEAAEHEGVKMEFLAAPVRVNVEDERMASIDCIRMELGEPDSSGRRRPVMIPNSEYTLKCDWVISAIGQGTDLTGVVSDEKIKITKWSTIVAQPGTFVTDRPGVFSGGDVVTGPADAIDAIAAGKKAAEAIDRFIRTGEVVPLRKRFESKRDNFHKLQASDLPPLTKSGKHTAAERPAEDRVHDFEEVEFAYSDQDAMEETLRCAECGCDAGLACILQNYCTEYGVDQKRFVGEFNRYKVDTRHPFIKIDSNKCIRCGRCVNTCAEVLNVAALGFVNRGFRTIVKPALDKALNETNCVSCGNCCDVCPTGAIIERMPFRRSGPWIMEPVHSICNFCSVGCNITINVKSSEVFFVSGAPPDNAPNNGELCVRGRFGYEQYLDGTRRKKPMVRKGGQLVETTWDEAFAAAKAGLKHIMDEHGNDSILVSASPKLTTEQLYSASRLARAVIGTNNMLSFHSLVNEADMHGLDDMLGATLATVDIDEFLNADLYLVVGGNPTHENPVLGWKMKRRMKQGVKSVVINSASIDLTAFATVWADPRRGSITKLINGIIAELLRRNAIDENFIAERTTGFDLVRDEYMKYDPDEAEAVTGVSQEKIAQIADLLADPTRKIVAWFNIESRIDRSSNDLRALASLLMILGKIGVPGSGLALLTTQCNARGLAEAGFDSRLLPGGVPVNETNLKRVEKAWGIDCSKIINESGTNIARKMREDRIRGAVFIAENPAAAPDYNAFVNALEFRVVCDLFLTETAQSADVFLPLSTSLETTGHLTNWCGMHQPLTPIGEPANGLYTLSIIARLSAELGTWMSDDTVAVAAELASLTPPPAPFRTADGKAHFVPYASVASHLSASVPMVLELDARVADRISHIKA